MAQNFIAVDRDQAFLMPPSLREWLPEDHFAWFVLAAAEEMDLAAFYADYRRDGHGRAAHDPAMMVALLLYAYAIGERSSRRIERRCVEDVATRVICANQRPDHTTIARFRQRHETALAGLFGEVLALCAEAGLVEIGVVAVDGTKVHANASQHATRTYEEIAREILAEADAVDAAEDEQFGERRGDELPPELATAQGRRGWLREAKRRGAREPLCVRSHGNHDRLIGGVKDLIRNDVRVRIAPSPRILAGDQCVLRDIHQRRASAAGERDADSPAGPRERSARALRDGCENCDRGVFPRNDIGQRDSNFHRGAIALPRNGHPPALGLDDKVIAWTRAVRTKTGDRAPDERRVVV